jgi:asparagine synthase (glutamine-hydrolysing)
MCGIVGILNFQKPINPVELNRFTDSLSHRGPDGRGMFIDGNLGLGHRRLAILDLSEAGKNPMPFGGEKGKRYWITYNGEVYNFLELRHELKELGHRFQSETDTEVVVAAYAQWGEDCLLRFNGMWAFAIWDTVERKLFLARDRFGIKPLYYLQGASRFAFASELKAFLALDNFSVALNEEIIPQIIQSNQAYEGTTDSTIMKNVLCLPGGHCLTLKSDGSCTIKTWWETLNHIPQIPTSYEEQVEQFRDLFLDAVKIRMRSDVAVGTCLSGGIDSSAVASGMAWNHRQGKNGLERCAEDWQQAFVATFPGTQLDERAYADEVIYHVGAKPHYWVFDNDEALSHIIDSVWAMEDVYLGIAVPVWCIYREMRQKNVVVSLDGHGGDELLGGYTWYLDWPMNQVNQNLYQDFHTTLLPSILRNYDRCSMAHGIEVRMPLMDWRLVTFTFGLPADCKIGAGYTKRVLRDAMRGIMPEKIRHRRSKIGFNSPMIDWYNGGMATMLRKIVNHRLWLESPFWDGHQLRDYVLEKTNACAWTPNDWGVTLHIWTLVNIVLWQLLFVEKSLSEIR